MDQPREDNVIAVGEQSSSEWAKLIRKLHWIGLHDEARRLELAVSTLPPEQRGTVLVGPVSTD
jgi:hypothetical protein